MNNPMGIRERIALAVFTIAAAMLVAGRAAWCDEIARGEYLKQLPLGTPRLVEETAASRDLHLYGDRDDPAYRDVDPVDGIDDERHRVLMDLSVRFAPYLVQNTTNIPVNFQFYIENRDTFALYIDTWDVSGMEPELMGTRGVNLSALDGTACPGVPGQAFTEQPLPTRNAAAEDCKLAELLARYAPGGSLVSAGPADLTRSRPQLLDVMFFNFPGDGPDTWETAYEPEYELTPESRRRYFPHANVHPFLIEADGGGYEIVLQYWFFYPTNDSGMDHEGDWEHINVVISPRSMVERSLSADEVGGILSGRLPATDDAPDPLVIKRVDYYFHHLVMTLDFSSPNVYQPREAWKEEVKRRPQVRFQEDEIWRDIRNMAYVDDDETIVNTHPFGYIGSDNKGLNQALQKPGGSNRDAHGTYPLSGRYQNVGPGGTTDQVSVHVDPREYWKHLASGKETKDVRFKRGHVLALDNPDRLRIVPDWERVIELTRNDSRMRREWSWLVLPIRWGYPATKSPFSGILEHFDTGNVAPVGPSFNAGWNVSGPSSGFTAYEPHTMPSLFPLGAQDSFRNDLGFLNLTLPLLFNLPPLDFITRIAVYPFKLAFGRRDPVYYPKEGIPFRFVGLSSGVSTQTFGDDFTALSLNPEQYDEFILQLVFHLLTNGSDSTTTIVSSGDTKTTSVGPFFQVAFYVGSHFTSENTVRNSRMTFGFDAEFNNVPPYSYRAELNYWEYAGSVRYSILTSHVQPFIKGGYGWSWYRLENVQANGNLFVTPETSWIKPKHIWPNVWHYGLGIEYIPWKNTGKLPGGTDVAFRFEYVRYTQTLGLDLTSVPLSRLNLIFDKLGDVPGGERVSRNDFLFGMTVSF